MARRRRVVLTAPGYAVEAPLGSAGGQDSHPQGPHWSVNQGGGDWGQPPSCHLVPIVQPQGSTSARPGNQPPQTQALIRSHAGLDTVSRGGLPCNATPAVYQSAAPSEFDMQVHLHRQAQNVSWVAVCPSMLEPDARMFLTELSAWYHAQGCGTHLPLPACTHVKRMGGIAPVPPDAVSATGELGGATRAGIDLAPASVRGMPGAATGACRAGAHAHAVMHPALGIVSNHAGPMEQQSESAFGTLPSHRWSQNYRATLAGLRHSLAAHVAEARPVGAPRDAVLVYLISPSDDAAVAAACLAEAVTQLGSVLAPHDGGTDIGVQGHGAATEPLYPSQMPGVEGAQGSGVKVEGQAAPQDSSHAVACGANQGAWPPTNHSSSLTGRARQPSSVTFQVLLPSLLQSCCSDTSCQAALAVYAQVQKK